MVSGSGGERISWSGWASEKSGSARKGDDIQANSAQAVLLGSSEP